MFAYGRVTCRGDSKTLQLDVSDTLIDEAVSVARCGDDNIIESYLNDVIENIDDYDVSVLLNGIATDSNTDLSRWDDHHTITVCLEEYEFGVAPTAKEAKLAWVDMNE